MDETVSPGESWRTQWPTSASVDAWYLAAADKALHITDSFVQIHELWYLVERLTSRGSIEAARRVCDDLLRQNSVHEGDRLDRVVVHRVTAAEALWSVDREDEALTMLAQTLTMLGHGGRTNKRNRVHIQYVREMALKIGVLGEWFSDITEVELTTLASARQRRALSRVDRVLRQEGAEAARVQLHATLPPTALGAAPMWRRYAAVGDPETARRLFESLALSDQERESCWLYLVGLGQRDRVLRLASQAITAHLEEARAMALPNYHHVAGAIARTLEYLREAGEVDAVRLHLGVVLKEVAMWNLAWSGWVEAAVRSAFAGVVARLDGLPAAEGMLEAAILAAARDRTSFRGSGWLSVIQVFVSVGAWDRALALTPRLNDRKHRRRETATLLVAAGRWEELQPVLGSVGSPDEAAKIASWIAGHLDRRGR